jgi:Concanavalin A-like lectin/glucanases superfamily
MALIDNLVSYYKLDEASGNRADSHGSNTLTDVNSVLGVTGKINNGADFETSSTQSLTITDASQSGLDITGSMSLSFWMNLETAIPSAGNQYEIASKTAFASGNYGWDLYLLNQGGAQRLYFAQSANGTSFTQPFWSFSPSTSTWYHIVVVQTVGTNVELYINGTSQGTGSAVASNFNNNGNFYLARGFSNNLDGILDEFGIWSRALTSAEVTSLYNAGAGLAYPFSAGAPTPSRLPMMGVG